MVHHQVNELKGFYLFVFFHYMQLMLFTVVTFPYLTQILATNVRFLREQLQNNNISSAFTSISEILDGLTGTLSISVYSTII